MPRSLKNNLLLLCLLTSLLLNAQDNRIWATYYGGSSNEGYDGSRVATDMNGNVYLAGWTSSTNGIASNGYQNSFGGTHDAFLVKFDPSGNRIWATYYGGSGTDEPGAIATDQWGNIYLAGNTNSSSGIASGGSQNSFGGGYNDAFLVKFDPSGNRLWATYYGGSGSEYGYGVTTDMAGNVYLSGKTSSSVNISSNGFQNTFGGNVDAFLVKFAPNGTRCWGTYFGASGIEDGIDVKADAFGFIYMCGSSGSSSGIAYNGFQNSYGGGAEDAYLVKFDTTGNRIWATYYGGSAPDEFGSAVAVDKQGNVFLAGMTQCTTAIAYNGFQDTFGGGVYDSYLVKFDPSGNRLWATYYGGADNEETESLATDESDNVFLAGDTYSSSGIAFNGFRNNLAGLENQYVVKFGPSGNRICATYYGNAHEEDGHVATDPFGNVYLAGTTNSSFGIASGGFQNSIGGNYDAYLVKFSSPLQTGTSLPEEENSLLLFPNPSEGRLTIDGISAGMVIQVFDSNGKLVYSTIAAAGRIEVDLSEESGGLYFVQISDGTNVRRQKLLLR